MEKTKILALKRKTIVNSITFVLLLGVATIAPLFHFQPLTGRIVNATLFIAATLLGVQNAIFIGLLPSTIALSAGLLPPVLAPMVPFIILGNTILIVAFNYLRKKNYWLGVISASVLKFLFLFGASSIVINLLLKREVATKVAVMMSWPQLATALTGGIIAYLFLKVFFDRGIHTKN